MSGRAGCPGRQWRGMRPGGTDGCGAAWGGEGGAGRDAAAPAAVVQRGGSGGGRGCNLHFLGRYVFLSETSGVGWGVSGWVPLHTHTHTHPGGSARLGSPPRPGPPRPLCPSQRFAEPGGCCFPPPVLQCGGCGYIGSTSQPRVAAVAAPVPAPPLRAGAALPRGWRNGAWGNGGVIAGNPPVCAGVGRGCGGSVCSTRCVWVVKSREVWRVCCQNECKAEGKTAPGEGGHPPCYRGCFVVLLILSVLVHRALKCCIKKARITKPHRK